MSNGQPLLSLGTSGLISAKLCSSLLDRLTEKITLRGGDWRRKGGFPQEIHSFQPVCPPVHVQMTTFELSVVSAGDSTMVCYWPVLGGERTPFTVGLGVVLLALAVTLVSSSLCWPCHVFG